MGGVRMFFKKVTILASAAMLSMTMVGSANASANGEGLILKGASTLNPKVLQLAEKAFYCASKRGVVNKQFLTIIDYSQPSTKNVCG